jgi:hypothetical protein
MKTRVILLMPVIELTTCGNSQVFVEKNIQISAAG